MSDCTTDARQIRIGHSRPQRWFNVGFRRGTPRRGMSELNPRLRRDLGLPECLPSDSTGNHRWDAPKWWY